ncbi:hypothetical protein IGS59_03395 [Janthinobacterium sp. GW460P]|uniref:hypothetical protein n=1 Tax=unclassified Janthinobacterium TaxID=2610881 RepID=UPI000A31FEB0|nr:MULTISPECIES: hypothetical protein [unclassified Janthinobacterium]MCC7701271.1 hypothetical protein [Janthinobacterium sp. GW460P]MCC7706778.1 hypothetical protein [Janthinobacterium sp. GW460W]
MTARHWLMLAGVLGAGALLLFGERQPVSSVAEAVERAVAPAPAGHAAAKAPAAQPAILALLPRSEVAGEDGDTFGGAGAVFQSQNWNPPPPKVVAVAPPPPPPPMAPPLPFVYLGKAAADGAWEVFLSRADKTYIVRANTVIDGAYKVVTIAPPVMTLTYLPLNQVQQLNIGVIE